MAWGSVQFSVNIVKVLSYTSSTLGKGVRYVAGLGKSSTGVLSDEVEKLRALRVEIVRESGKSNNEVEQRWLREAADLIDEADRFKGSRIQGVPCLRDCPCWATDMLQRVQQMNNQGAGLRSKGRQRVI